MSGSRSLNVRLLVTKVQKISDWFMLGVHLGVPNEELNKIDQRFSMSHGVERCKAELFDLWLRRNPSARWDDVASALEQLNEMALASELRALSISNPIPACLAAPRPSSALVDKHNEVEQETVRVELGKSTVRKFAKLESKFALLVCNVKTTTGKSGVLPEKFHSFLEVRLNQKIEFVASTSISDLFERITPYYCFLNTTLLENIIEEFLGEPLQQQLDEYEGLLEEFTSSTKISLLKKIDLKTSAQHKGMPLVVLKLSGRYLDVTINRFQELVRYIFGKKSSALSNIQVEDGCICITWNTRESAVPSLINMAFEKTQFMKVIGILRLTVKEVTIIEQLGTDEDNSSLEDYLMQSVILGCIEAVEFLLTAGADPCHYDASGRSVLSIASLTGSTMIAKLLIDAGADVNQVNLNGSKLNPLMLACEKKHDDMVLLLLQSGADPNLQTGTGQTALLSVDYSDYRSLGIVRALLEAGADVNCQNSLKCSSLVLACEYGCYEIAELLIQFGANVNLSTFDGHTPLMIACQMKREDIAFLLLTSNADTNLQTNKSQTALMLACGNQLAHTVSLLLSNGADPNLQNDYGWTALMFSLAVSVHEFDDCIPVQLLSAGANPNIQTKAGFTALMVAVCFKGSGVGILLNAQADVSAQDKLGNTVLHHSASDGDNLTKTELLLSAGADPTTVNVNGKTPVDVALKYRQHEICQLLLSASTTRSTETTAQKQVDPHKLLPQKVTTSSVSTTPHQELDQLRCALRHPLPPAGTTKCNVEDIEDDENNILPQIKFVTNDSEQQF